MEEKKVKIKKDNSNSKNKNNKIKSYLLSLEKRANKKTLYHFDTLFRLSFRTCFGIYQQKS